MVKEQRWCIRYARTINGETVEKVCYPKNEEAKSDYLDAIKAHGGSYKLLSCKKLYPFNMAANQHNFSFVSDICYNRIHDMEFGEIPWDDAEYDRLQARKEKAERFFCWAEPVAWLPWEDWKDAKEIAESAVFIRQERCIEAGRPELVPFC